MCIHLNKCSKLLFGALCSCIKMYLFGEMLKNIFYWKGRDAQLKKNLTLSHNTFHVGTDHVTAVFTFMLPRQTEVGDRLDPWSSGAAIRRKGLVVPGGLGSGVGRQRWRLWVSGGGDGYRLAQGGEGGGAGGGGGSRREQAAVLASGAERGA